MISQENLKNASELIKRSQKILIVLAENLNLDSTATAALLAGHLLEIKKDVSVSIPAPLHSRWNHLPLSALTKSSGVPRDLIININTAETPVGGIRYDKQEKNLSIIVSPKDKALDLTNVSLKFGSGATDLIIVIGASRLDDIGDEYQKNPQLFFDTPVINLDNSPANDQFGEVNLVDLKAVSRTQIAEALLKILQPDKTLTPDDATLILCGILVSTNNFLGRKVDAETLTLAADAIRAGGDRAAVLDALELTPPISAVQLFARAVLRTRFENGHRRMITVITADDFIKTNSNPTDLLKVSQLLADHLGTASMSIILYENPKTARIKVMGSSPRLEVLKNIADILHAEIRLGMFWSDWDFATFKSASDFVNNTLNNNYGSDLKDDNSSLK